LVAKDAAIGERLYWHQNALGGVMDPFSAYMSHRGLKSLHVRMERHADNAQDAVPAKQQCFGGIDDQAHGIAVAHVGQMGRGWHGDGFEHDEIGLSGPAVDNSQCAGGLEQRVGDFDRQIHDVGHRVKDPHRHPADAQPVIKPACAVIAQRGEEHRHFDKQDDKGDDRDELE
jgi:hypothetical protein